MGAQRALKGVLGGRTDLRASGSPEGGRSCGHVLPRRRIAPVKTLRQESSIFFALIRDSLVSPATGHPRRWIGTDGHSDHRPILVHL